MAEYETRITKKVEAIVTIIADSLEEAQAKYDEGDWDNELDIGCDVEDDGTLIKLEE